MLLNVRLGCVCFLIVASSAGAADYFVAPVGSDENPGTISRSFATIQHAADVVKPGDTCYVRAGTYRQTVRIKASGRKGSPIRFAAYQGEAVTLSGTESVNVAWSVHKGEIYKARLKGGVSQLFADGRAMIEARWPNRKLGDLWNKDSWRPGGKGTAYGKIVDDALAATGINWTGALASLNVGSWQTYLRRVTNHKAGSNTLEYPKDMAARLRLNKKRRREGHDHYFLFGTLEALDAPGEWFYDTKASTLYFRTPDGKSPTKHKIERKVRSYAFLADGCSYVQLSGLGFFASTFMFDRASNCIIENCWQYYPTGLGTSGDINALPKTARRRSELFLRGLRSLAPTLLVGNGNTVRNCTIAYGEAPGIVMGGRGNTLDNCLIRDIDWRGLAGSVMGNAGAVHVATSAASTVRRCTVLNAGSSEGLILSSRGPSLCEYNYVHHIGLFQSDGGCIQCSGLNQAGTIIRYNWVHDHNAFKWGGIGIRGDDLTRNLIVHHNVAWSCREKGIITKGDKNKVFNNTSINNQGVDILLPSRPEPFKPWAPRQHPHLLKKQNEHTELYNNCAKIISGTFKWQRKIEPPLGPMKNNYRGGRPDLVDPDKLDFRPRAGSPLVDAGMAIEGYTDGFKGKAPDVGAYEHGAPRWVPGYRNALWLIRDKQGKLTVRLLMEPLETVTFAINDAATPKLTFTPDNWMKSQTVESASKTLKFSCSEFGLDGSVDVGRIDLAEGTKLLFRTIQ